MRKVERSTNDIIEMYGLPIMRPMLKKINGTAMRRIIGRSIESIGEVDIG